MGFVSDFISGVGDFLGSAVDTVTSSPLLGLGLGLATGGMGSIFGLGDALGAGGSFLSGAADFLPDAAEMIGGGAGAMSGGSLDTAISYGLGSSTAEEASQLLSQGGNIGNVANAAGASKGPLAFLNTPLGGGVTYKDVLGTGLNYLKQQDYAGKLQDIANQASAKADPNAAFRTYAQNQFQQNATPEGAKAFMSTNPAIQGQIDIARQQYEAAAGKSGVGGTPFNAYLKNLTDIMSGQYNQQQSMLAGIAQTSPGYAGNVYQTPAMQSAAVDNSAWKLPMTMIGGGIPSLQTSVGGKQVGLT